MIGKVQCRWMIYFRILGSRLLFPGSKVDVSHRGNSHSWQMAKNVNCGFILELGSGNSTLLT